MIDAEQLIEIGSITKLHGLKGEMTVHVTDPVFADVQDCPYLVCRIDGIFVPFFIADYRFRTESSLLLRFDDIDTPEEARTLCGQTLYFDRKCFSPQEAKHYEAEQAAAIPPLIGYTLIDQTAGPVGTITDIDDQTANVLFIVDHNGEELLIPAAEEIIETIDDAQRTIVMNLPVGLLDPDQAETDT